MQVEDFTNGFHCEYALLTQILVVVYYNAMNECENMDCIVSAILETTSKFRCRRLRSIFRRTIKTSITKPYLRQVWRPPHAAISLRTLCSSWTTLPAKGQITFKSSSTS